MPIAIPICATVIGVTWVIGNIIECAFEEFDTNSSPYVKELEARKEEAIAKQKEYELEMKKLEMKE